MEQLLLIYRTIVTVPCWLLFYEGIGMGSLLTSLMRGAHSSHQQLPCLSESLDRGCSLNVSRLLPMLWHCPDWPCPLD